MQQLLYKQNAVRQTTAGGFHRVLRKNVSYNKYEDHIQQMEKELMKKHRLGYSGLHKFLILKESQQHFSIPFTG